MVCQCRFINCNKGTALGDDIDNGEGYACKGAGSTWGISVPSAQFCCEPKTALKKEGLLEKETEKFGLYLRVIFIVPLART